MSNNRNRKSVSQSTTRLPMGMLLIVEAFIEGFDLMLEFLLRDDEVRKNQNERSREPRIVIPAKLFLDLLSMGKIEGRPGDGLILGEMLADGSLRLVLATSTMRDLSRTVPADAYWTHLAPKMAVERTLDRGVVAYVKDRIDMKVRHLNEETAIRERFHSDRPRREDAPAQQPQTRKGEERQPERASASEPRITVTDLASKLGVSVDTVRQAMVKAATKARQHDDSLPHKVVDRVEKALKDMSGEAPKAPAESPKDPVQPQAAKPGPVVEHKRPEKKAKKERKRNEAKKAEPEARASSSGSFAPKLGDKLGHIKLPVAAPATTTEEAPAYASVAETDPAKKADSTANSDKETPSDTNGAAVH